MRVFSAFALSVACAAMLPLLFLAQFCGGGVVVTSQDDLDEISGLCTTINGSIGIDENYSEPFALNGVTNITGGLEIHFNEISDKIQQSRWYKGKYSCTSASESNSRSASEDSDSERKESSTDIEVTIGVVVSVFRVAILVFSYIRWWWRRRKHGGFGKPKSVNDEVELPAYSASPLEAVRATNGCGDGHAGIGRPDTDEAPPAYSSR
ncbi:uncharacterized protein BDV17DRAFT_295734 [Aspergillus undulatus]|uniref:uncharacterized protein n=1 Tax=Aspergillus undulatus TaxID=1810928 RepID=UPI003CCCE2F0